MVIYSRLKHCEKYHERDIVFTETLTTLVVLLLLDYNNLLSGLCGAWPLKLFNYPSTDHT